VRTEATWGRSRTHGPADSSSQKSLPLSRTRSAYFDGVTIQTKALFGGQEFLYIFALITLKLNHLTHLWAVDDGAIASCRESVSNEEVDNGMRKHTELFLDDLENLLLVKFYGDSLNGGQGLATISLWEQSQP